MLKIAICDDDTYAVTAIKEQIKNYCRQNQVAANIVTFTNGSDLLEAINSDANGIELLFIDIELKNGSDNGIEVAAKINETAPNCQIAFLTNYLHYVVDAYQTNHFYYLLKEEFAVRLPDVMQKARDRIKHTRKNWLIVNPRGVRRVIDKEEILYIERVQRTTYIYTAAEVIQTRQSFKELKVDSKEEIDFVRCHVSYVVRFQAVKAYKRTEFVLYSGKVIPISRNYADHVREAFAFWSRAQL